ncbi:AraC family transcriptional regulator [Bradyrhizobium sp. AUGA SZCCT0177]|uniref:helix-turn-helix domain-containing protein n=1 Tax=unclassified Bradyrhizobium TaxID=2631580 RepID=UPI001BAB6465|nr:MULTISPECIES: helix-turn-helix domain-containing protein [unclassified Bradyrhizobium]MBR1233579.1 AraC family transcriptional regulator [Bradyrhizobium sp. AUGA SZCCT0182]MBR1283408.1 AraC family transcriptional regulator [Bradyrhizobium sp. AUGA SZCCT0177]
MKTLRRDIACITFSSRFLPLNTSISMSFLFLDSSRHPTSLLQRLRTQPNDHLGGQSLSQIETGIFDIVLDTAELIESSHRRASVARAVLDLRHGRLDDPPGITELCIAVAAKERTLHLSCVEAFGRPPAALLAELRLHAARRALSRPGQQTNVTAVAALYGFTHFGRSAEIYRRQFAELPSATLSRARGA